MFASYCLSSKCVVCLRLLCFVVLGIFLVNMLANWFGEVVASIVNYVAACVLIELGVIFGVGIVLAQALVPMYATYLSYQLLRFLMENPQSNKNSFKDYLNKCFLGLVSVGLGSSLFVGLLSCSAWAYAQSRFLITFGEGLIGY